MPNGLPPEPLPPIKAAMVELLTVLMLLRHLRVQGRTYDGLTSKLETEAHRLVTILIGGLP